LKGMAWYISNSDSRTHAVGSKLPNAFGLFDMHGNVWEWCEDSYDSGYYSRSPVNDPPGSSNGKDRILRGGAFSYPASNLRSAFRLWDIPDRRIELDGLRIVAVARTQ